MDQPQNSSNLKERAKVLLSQRQKLPIWKHAGTIKEAIRSKDVLLLSGETGSGKSTQAPQFLLDEVGGCIAITQPRRVAAITLARRVAQEVGSPLGSASPASKVGYSVRFDNSTSPNTRIKFLTEGMLLQEMLRDPWLRQYSAVVVDEVHERGVNVDLILGFLRRMVVGDSEGRGGVPLKVVVMSATADIESLRNFFEEGYEKDTRDKEDFIDEPDWNGFSDTKDGPNAQNDLIKEADLSSTHVSICSIEGRQFPVKIVYTPEPVQDIIEDALRLIFQIHKREALPGNILVFLTGQEAIESLKKLVNDYAADLDFKTPKLLVLPLFAALPQAAQQKVFQPTPSWTRKVILSTNIAETSLTVPGVRFVIDCGKHKIKHFRTSLGLDTLLSKPISKSSAIQRKGRAGREAPGQCYRLYTEEAYRQLEETSTPEILRCDLAQAILNMKARGVDDIIDFPFLDRPRRESLEKALLQLLNLGALTETGSISKVGRQIARLPLSAPLGRVLIAAIDNYSDCLSDVLDIISALSVENVFLNLTSEESREKAEQARRSLYRREGDHLTLLTTVQAYAAEQTDRRAWSEKHFVNHRAMQAVMVSFHNPFTIHKLIQNRMSASSFVPKLRSSPKPSSPTRPPH